MITSTPFTDNEVRQIARDINRHERQESAMQRMGIFGRITRKTNVKTHKSRT